jgi:ATP-dependent Zn protease
MQGEIDSAVRALIAHQASRAESIVRDHATALDAIARALIDRGVLMASEVFDIAADHGVPLQQSIDRAELIEA